MTPSPPAKLPFHPAVNTWFRRTFAAPTPAQAEAWPVIRSGQDVLIAAPTGSGKTLAAFLAAIDDLVREGEQWGLPDETRIVYVSPLKALSNDIHRNLEAPLSGIRECLRALNEGGTGDRGVSGNEGSADRHDGLRGRPGPNGQRDGPGIGLGGTLRDVEIRTWVRTGDTPQYERAQMRRKPPHIVVTTPESLYILLGSQSGRDMLATTRAVIVDEIHAVAGNKRGSHLSLSLQRLEALAPRRPVRIGLSATQQPLEEVARFLVGARRIDEHGRADCRIIDRGHLRRRDLALELPDSPLEAVMSNEVWTQVYDRLAQLVREHRTTLIFVNTRRMAERVCRHVSERVDARPGVTDPAIRQAARGGELIVEFADPMVFAPDDGAPTDAAVDAMDAAMDRATDIASIRHATPGVADGHAGQASQAASTRSARRHPMRSSLVAAHHGSLAKDRRFDAEQRLKSGQLKALVATASLELGIDIGDVDLVCQLSTPRSINAFLQRVGRSGHAVGGTPKGRLFPLSRDDLAECTALLDSVRRGELDRLSIPSLPLDVLAQQIVAEAAAREWTEVALFELLRGAYPFRALTRESFAEIVHMLAEGFTTRRGRQGALLYHDAVNHLIRGRKGARLTAITSGGAIPDTADYQVMLEPEGHLIGTVNEDFAVESLAGDVFQLGNASYRILRIERSTVRVEDAHGEAPSIPFWLGEAPGRTDELSAAVSRLRSDIAAFLEDTDASAQGMDTPCPPISETAPVSLAQRTREEGADGADSPSPSRDMWPTPMSAGRTPDHDTRRTPRPTAGGLHPGAMHYLADTVGIGEPAAAQLLAYYTSAHAALGCLPTRQTLVFERFFDEAGGMQLVIHSPFGSRINRAWGLALRKRFCRTFNFELQAAATEDTIILSLTTAHSFELEAVARFLHPHSARDLLVQALLAAPMFTTRWRWTAAIALALPRFRGGKKVPPPLARMNAEDLLAAVFPDQVACGENLTGDIVVPDHPLVRQTVRDCLEEAMDIAGFERLLGGLADGTLRVVARDLTEPSPLALEVLSARPYAFLDDAPLEERRTQAVLSRRWLDPESAADIGRLDPDAIARVRTEAWPDAASPDELHDALLWLTFLSEQEVRQAPAWPALLHELITRRRACTLRTPAGLIHVAAERLALLRAILPDACGADEVFDTPAAMKPASRLPEAHARIWSRDEALRELVRGRLSGLGPVTADALTPALDLPTSDIEAALLALEAEGSAIRGQFDPSSSPPSGRPADLQWCDRRLLARIHRYTVKRLRANIEPVQVRDFLNFLFDWQHINPGTQMQGPDAVPVILAQLEGVEAPAAAWETEILPARIAGYEPAWLDEQCQSGRIVWTRLAGRSSDAQRTAAPVRTTPIVLLSRREVRHWTMFTGHPAARPLTGRAQQILSFIQAQGASFFDELTDGAGLLPSQVEEALAELVASGRVNSDRFGGLRALLVPADRRRPTARDARRRRRTAIFGMQDAGRWALVRRTANANDADEPERRMQAIEHLCRTLLRRWGVVFWKLLEREAGWLPPWRDLLPCLRRLEARGEIRGGRFVAGLSGEQFALPEAVGALRAIRRRSMQHASAAARGRDDAPGICRSTIPGGPPIMAQGTAPLDFPDIPHGAFQDVSLSAADPLNLIGILTPGARLPSLTGNRLLYRGGLPVAIHAGGEVSFLETLTETARWQVRGALLRRRIPARLTDLA